MNEKKIVYTSIGGQALIEGVMMRGPYTSAMAVRKPDGEIEVSTWETETKKRPWYKTTPFVRGIFNFIDMITLGYRCLMRSAELAGVDDEEPTGLEKKLMDLLGEKFTTVFSWLAMILGAALAVGLFMVLPTIFVGILRPLLPSQLALASVEACIKIGIFVLYLWATSRVKEIQRVFEYHGAEHKTIACFEAGEELTPENAKKHTRFHPRCGTSFLLIVMVVSVLVFSMVTWENLLIRIGLKLVMLPVVVGIAYEIIKLAGKYQNPVTRAISAPGLWLQRLTTREPDLEQLAVAIAAMTPCIPEDGSDRG